ncbi:MAG: cell wall-binding repeat-containing protein, partial [Actinomycetota bacterium]|nr:cell wall-binding repeat-containing protein [Actinomycetota bacterium]
VDVALTPGAGDRVGTVTLTGALSGLTIGGSALTIDDVIGLGSADGLPIVVDESTDLLLVATSWQLPGPSDVTQLLDPAGTPAAAGQRRSSTQGVAEVWEVQDPQPGIWRLVVDDIGQEVVVNASARTDLALDLLPFPSGLTAGALVPVLTSFVGSDGPIVGADVQATVQAPDGGTSTLALHDDGNHGDGLADDGIYGNRYQTGPAADTLTQQGSYLVAAVGSIDGHRREAQGSFAVARSADNDGDGLPDDWEVAHGLDPTDPDADRDPDGDGLPNDCELEGGTHPTNSDTDHGGTRDDAELDPSTCRPRPDRHPRDPDDDPVDPVSSARLRAELAADGLPILVAEWGATGRGELDHVELFCTVDGGPFARVGPDLTGRRHVIDTAAVGSVWQCRVHPFVVDDGGMVVPGRVVLTGEATVASDPYPPVGSVVIDGGAVATADRLVDLTLEANDHLPGDEHEGEGPVPGDAPSDLEMRIGNDEDLSDAPWQPFSATVPDWDLGEIPAGQVASVFAQFRDTAGNISQGPEGDDILVVGGQRLAGPSRVETAVDISQADFPDGGAGAVVLARADEFPDAIAGTPLAVEVGAPILLTQTGSLHPATAQELARVLPRGRTVYVLGGTVAVGDQVVEAVRALGYAVQRVAGPTRFETAVAVADALDGPRIAMIATHDDFAAALAAGPAAGVHDGAILLSAADAPHPATQAWIADHPEARVVAVGQPAVAAHPEAEPVVGTSREGTAVAVADAFFERPGVVGLARSSVFADALTGGPHMARMYGPLLLTPDDTLDPDAEAWVCRQPNLAGWFAYGGVAAIAPPVIDALADRIEGEGCPG